MQRRYITVDVFTDRAFGGNPLAVVLDAGGRVRGRPCYSSSLRGAKRRSNLGLL
jgi:hypothetical protein